MTDITVPLGALEALPVARWTLVSGVVGEGLDASAFAVGVSHRERLLYVLLDEGEEAGAYAIRLEDLLGRVLDVHRPHVTLAEEVAP